MDSLQIDVCVPWTAWTALVFEWELDARSWPELRDVVESEFDLDGRAAQ